LFHSLVFRSFAGCCRGPQVVATRRASRGP
jgi:hypothetical protein